MVDLVFVVQNPLVDLVKPIKLMVVGSLGVYIFFFCREASGFALRKRNAFRGTWLCLDGHGGLSCGWWVLWVFIFDSFRLCRV